MVNAGVMGKENDCIFCKLGKSNPRMIFEDKSCYVIPDRFPSEYGHLLVISKEHTESMLTAPDALVTEMFTVAKRFGLKLKEAFDASGVTIMANNGKDSGQIIFHFHIHIMPKYSKKIGGFMSHRELDDQTAVRIIAALKH